MTSSPTTRVTQTLPSATSVLAVCAHPDDESFGLGAVLAGFVDAGAAASVLCYTHGEASTLGDAFELGRVRGVELADAARELGVSGVELLDYPDGALAAEPLEGLAARVRERAEETRADVLLVFDEGGITGHPDHQHATAAALVAAEEMGIAVLAWALSRRVADALRREFGADFLGRARSEVDLVVRLDRERQRRAISRHASQANDNPVLRRRLELQGDEEVLRWLPASSPAARVAARSHG